MSGKPRKGLGFHCFLTYPKFPIPPICPQPPQRYRPFDFERGYSDFTKKYPADDFERKKILQGILAIQWLCVSGEKPGKNYYQIPHPQPPPPPPRKSQMVGLLKQEIRSTISSFPSAKLYTRNKYTRSSGSKNNFHYSKRAY